MPAARLRTLLPLPVLAATVAVLAGAPASASAATCSTPKYPGTGYFTSLKVTGASCAVARKVMLAHYHCRVAHGVKGTCTKRVLGYKCTEKRESIPTQINARVTCTSGSRKVVYTYQQDI